jgi:TRAP-type uncharacterized transport system substrate-binding protein
MRCAFLNSLGRICALPALILTFPRIANKDVPADVVCPLLSLIYTDEGLAYMHQLKKTAEAMCVKDGIKGIVTPLHPGAIKFWKEKGIL